MRNPPDPEASWASTGEAGKCDSASAEQLGPVDAVRLTHELATDIHQLGQNGVGNEWENKVQFPSPLCLALVEEDAAFVALLVRGSKARSMLAVHPT